MTWPSIEPVVSARLRLTPLAVGHAESMAAALADPGLYRFTGGAPPTVEELRRRYSVQAVGHSPDGHEGWFNWVLAPLREPALLIGYVQATVTGQSGDREAELAWVLAPSHQGEGLAGEATTAIMDWLRRTGITRFVAHVHPEHAASIGVARRVGLTPTDVVVDGETRWRS